MNERRKRNLRSIQKSRREKEKRKVNYMKVKSKYFIRTNQKYNDEYVKMRVITDAIKISVALCFS